MKPNKERRIYLNNKVCTNIMNFAFDARHYPDWSWCCSDSLSFLCSRSSIDKRQRKVVTSVVLCMFVVIATTISWGVPILLARNQPEPDAGCETDLCPSDSKEGHYTRAAVSADCAACPPIGRY